MNPHKQYTSLKLEKKTASVKTNNIKAYTESESPEISISLDIMSLKKSQ